MVPTWYTTLSTPRTAERIGTVDRTDLLIAYYASAEWDAVLKEMRAERDEAEAAGDEARAEELNAKGQALQDVAHRQLAGRAPLTNILDSLDDVLPDVARRAGVEIIVEEGTWPNEDAQFVDVTEMLLEYIEPAKR